MPLLMDENWRVLCHHCGAIATRSPRYDACYCEACDVWLEETCDDPECEFCVGRPERPSQADHREIEEEWDIHEVYYYSDHKNR